MSTLTIEKEGQAKVVLQDEGTISRNVLATFLGCDARYIKEAAQRQRVEWIVKEQTRSASPAPTVYKVGDIPKIILGLQALEKESTGDDKPEFPWIQNIEAIGDFEIRSPNGVVLIYHYAKI